jgi:hypothetical protein
LYLSVWHNHNKGQFTEIGTSYSDLNIIPELDARNPIIEFDTNKYRLVVKIIFSRCWEKSREHCEKNGNVTFCRDNG